MLNQHAKLEQKSDNEYLFVESDCVVKGLWVTVRNISVYITVADEGVIVDLYAAGKEIDGLAGTSLAFSDADEVEEC